MTRAAGSVDDIKIENRLCGVSRFHRPVEERIKRGFNLLVHERRRRVVGACRLAVVASRADERELTRSSIVIRYKLENALVKRANLFAADVAVVHRVKVASGINKAELPDRCEQIGVGDEGILEMRTFLFAKDAAESRETKARLSVRERPEHVLEADVEVVVAV